MTFDKFLNAYRPFEPHDEHVLRQPALPLGERGSDAEGEALLAEQRVAAIPGTEAEDLQRVGLVGDDQLVRVAGPLNL